MDKYTKLELTIVLLCTSVSILSIRHQYSTLLLLASTCLVALLIFQNSKYSIIGIAITLIFIYPGSHIGWLYGFDSHATASNTIKILESGWPVQAPSYGFPQTPLLHINTIITSIITDLAIFPSTQPRVLITSILPMIYTSITIFTTYCLIQRYNSHLNFRVPTDFLILVVVFWIPLVQFHTGFRRESIGILLFSSASLILVNQELALDKRGEILLLIFTLAVIAAHHLSSLILSLLIGCVVIWEIASKRPQIGGDKIKTTNTYVVLSAVLFASWYIISGASTEIFANRVGSLFGLSLLNDITEYIFMTSSNSQLNFTPIQRDTMTVITGLINEWIYQLLMAIGVVLLLIKQYHRSEYIDRWAGSMLVFGGVSGALSTIGWLSGSLPRTRIQSFFVIAGGWLALLGFRSMKRVIKVKPILIVFMILSASMIPGFIVSKSEPDYKKGDVRQTFPRSVYSTADFLEKFDHSKYLVAGNSVREVLLTVTDQPVLGRHRAIRNGTIPNGSKVILSKQNKDVYRGKNFREGRRIAFVSEGLFYKFNKNDEIYDAGKVRVYH